MSFPLMPINGAPTFAKGALTKVYSSAQTSPVSQSVTLGQTSEDRWVVVVLAGSSGGAIGTWTAPTCNGTSMTEIFQTSATGGNDGQRDGVWVLKVTQGVTCTIAGTFANLDAMQVFTLTGVRSAVTSAVVSQFTPDTATVTASVPACAIFVGVDNFGSVTSITNMTELVNLGGNGWFAVNYRTTANPTAYTIVKTSMFVMRVVTWPFDY